MRDNKRPLCAVPEPENIILLGTYAKDFRKPNKSRLRCQIFCEFAYA